MTVFELRLCYVCELWPSYDRERVMTMCEVRPCLSYDRETELRRFVRYDSATELRLMVPLARRRRPCVSAMTTASRPRRVRRQASAGHRRPASRAPRRPRARPQRTRSTPSWGGGRG